MVDLTCPKCKTPYREGQLVCNKCLNLLFDPKSSTVHMRIDPSLLRLRRKRELEIGKNLPERTVILQIRGLIEKLIFEEETEIVLGRIDLTHASADKFDLTAFGGHERGVSREHAVLRFQNTELTVTDLGSINGTSVNGKKLTSNETQTLKQGDELTLGSLSITVRFDRPDTGMLTPPSTAIPKPT